MQKVPSLFPSSFVKAVAGINETLVLHRVFCFLKMHDSAIKFLPPLPPPCFDASTPDPENMVLGQIDHGGTNGGGPVPITNQSTPWGCPFTNSGFSEIFDSLQRSCDSQLGTVYFHPYPSPTRSRLRWTSPCNGVLPYKPALS